MASSFSSTNSCAMYAFVRSCMCGHPTDKRRHHTLCIHLMKPKRQSNQNNARSIHSSDEPKRQPLSGPPIRTTRMGWSISIILRLQAAACGSLQSSLSQAAASERASYADSARQHHRAFRSSTEYQIHCASHNLTLYSCTSWPQRPSIKGAAPRY
jgi:hypothetical protein